MMIKLGTLTFIETITQRLKHTYSHTNTDSWTCVLLSERVLRQRVSQLLLGCWVSEETIIRAEKATALKWLQGEKKRERERDEKRRIETKIPDIEPIHFLKMPLRGYSRELESEARAIPTRRERERERKRWRDRRIKLQADKAAILTFLFPPSFEHRNRSIWMWIQIQFTAICGYFKERSPSHWLADGVKVPCVSNTPQCQDLLKCSLSTHTQNTQRVYDLQCFDPLNPSGQCVW